MSNITKIKEFNTGVKPPLSKNSKYYISIDVGTNSAGIAVFDENMQIIKIGGKPFWSSITYDTAQTAEERRKQRGLRRKYNKKRLRKQIVYELFENYKEYFKLENEAFISKMKNSFLNREDKKMVLGFTSKYNLFNGIEFTDKDYNKQFPTIQHLITYLCHTKVKTPLEYILIAIINFMNSRGHFLFDGQKLDLLSTNKIEDLEFILKAVCEQNNINYVEMFSNDKKDKLLDIVSTKISKKEKIERIKDILFFNSKQNKQENKEKNKEKNKQKLNKEQSAILEIFKGIVGLSFDLNVLFTNETFKDANDKNIKLSFSSNNFENEYEMVTDVLGDKISIIDSMSLMYAYSLCKSILGEATSISEAKVMIYEKHKKDLKKLKKLTLKAGKHFYNLVFKQTNRNVVNYPKYIRNIILKNPEKLITKEEKSYGDNSEAQFYDFIRYIINQIKQLKDFDSRFTKEEKKEFENILNDLENETYLLKQRHINNAAIPYQLRLAELTKILDNQSKYYPFLNEIKEEILSTFGFKIPYYYGPLSGKYAWIVKQEGKENERIYPWNHEQVVDQEATAINFMNNLIGVDSYLPNEKVMPKKSLTCSQYELLSELNKVRVNGELLEIAAKNKIIEDLFFKTKTVTEKSLKKWILKHNNDYGSFLGINSENDIKISGLQKDKQFASSLGPWIDFSKIFEVTPLELESNKELFEKSEEIITDISVFKDKDILMKRLKKYDLTEKQEAIILGLGYNGWSKLSRKLINGITTKNNNINNFNNLSIYGEKTILEIMRTTNLNLMEIINKKEFDFKDILEKEMKASFDNDEDLKNKNIAKIAAKLPISPSARRGFVVLSEAIKEIVRIMGCEPEAIFIEFARNEDKKVATKSRMTKLKNLYKDLKKKGLLDEHGEKLYKLLPNEKELANNKIYLFYSQLGRCMYSFEKIERDELFNCEVDHIVPRTLKTDNSLDNTVLVKKIENQRKSDDLVLSKTIRSKMTNYWNMLKDNDLITGAKYSKLVRSSFSQEQLNGFANKQLVDTRQMSKYFVNICLSLFKNTKVYTIRAGLTDQFRKKYNIPKFRCLNDLHHAHDAFIVGIIGTHIRKVYPNLEANFNYSDYKKNSQNKQNKQNEQNNLNNYSFVINSMNKDHFDKNGEIIWSADKINDVLKYFNYNNVLTNKKLDTFDGAFYNETVYHNKAHRLKGEPAAVMPLNDKRKDVDKYGGYSSINSVPIAIEGIKKINKDGSIDKFRKVVSLPLIYENKPTSEKINYLENYYGITNVSILKYFKKNQLIEIKGEGMFYMRSAQEIIPARQLTLNEKETKMLDDIYKALNKDNKNQLEHQNLLNKCEYLYDVLCNKFDILYPNFNKYQTIKNNLINKKTVFLNLNLNDRYTVITEIFNIFKNSPIRGNLTLLELSNSVGRICGISLNLDNIIFYDSSLTGVFKKQYTL